MIQIYKKHQTIALEVYREGEIDQTYYKEEVRAEYRQALVARIQAVGRALTQILRHCATALQNELKTVALLVTLDFFDHKHGTHLRHEYFEQKKSEQMSHLRAQFR